MRNPERGNACDAQSVDRGDLDHRLADGALLLGLNLAKGQRGQLLDYVELMLKWSRTYNLTAIRDPLDMLSVHLLDSLSILRLIPGSPHQSLIDVGSGAGLPAIPIAIMRPDIQVRAVDAVAKKIAFQRHVKAALDLENLHPIHSRVEDLKLPRPPSLVVSRAYADLRKMLASIDHFTGAATTVIAMKGNEPTAEIVDLPASWTIDDIVRLDVPFLGAQRCAVMLTRAS